MDVGSGDGRLLQKIYEMVMTTKRGEMMRRFPNDPRYAFYVIGGRHSSNSLKLLAVCKENCEKSFLIERAA